MTMSDQLHDTANFTSGKEPQYPLSRRLCGTQSRCGHFGEGHSHLPFNVSTCAVSHQAQETCTTVKLRACVPHENPVEELRPYFLCRVGCKNFFSLQLRPLTFFVSFFLLTSLRLDIYLSSPPYSRLTILYLKIWHRPSGSIFIPRHNRNKLRESQYAIFVCFTVTCMYHMPGCNGARS